MGPGRYGGIPHHPDRIGVAASPLGTTVLGQDDDFKANPLPSGSRNKCRAYLPLFLQAPQLRFRRAQQFTQYPAIVLAQAGRGSPDRQWGRR